MSSIQRVNFELVSTILATQVRDFGLADKTLIDPQNNSNPLIDGEWVTLDANGKMVPAASRASAGNAAAIRSFPLWAESGRWDIQAMSEKKTPIIYMGDYEFDTRVFDASAVVSGGAAITFVGQPLKVASISISGYFKCGLVGAVAGDGEPVVAIVTRLPSANGGKLRAMKAWAI